MQVQFCFVAAAIIAFAVTAFPTERDHHHSVKISEYTARSYQPASDLHNVSTYHPLTRGNGSVSHVYKKAYRRGYFGQYGLSPTTSYDNGQSFYTPIKFGADTFDVLIDTGSSDTWLAVTGAKFLNSTSGEYVSPPPGVFGPLWNPSGCVPIPNENFNIPYGEVAVDQGTFCTIDVTLAGITAKNQQVAAVSKVGFGVLAPSSGLLGLAYPSLTFAYIGTNISVDNHGINQAPYDPIFTTMVKQQKIPPVFSVALSRASKYYTEDGYIALGGLPPVITYGDWATAPIQYVAIDSPGGGYIPTVLQYPQYQWYTITPDAFIFDSSDNFVLSEKNWTSFPNPTGSLTYQDQYILDSGTTQVYLSPIIADAIAAKFDPPAVFNGAVYTIPCDAKAPWFAIQIGGVIFPIDKRDMIINDGQGNCYAGTNNGNIYAPYALGDVFMNNVLTVFDVGSGEMKFRSRGYY